MNTIERALYRGQDTVTGEWRFGYYIYDRDFKEHAIVREDSVHWSVTPETEGNVDTVGRGKGR